jgi:cytochrome c553
MNNSRLFALTLSLGAALASGSIQADGNVEAGKAKSTPCMGCHAIEGAYSVYPSFRVPKLSGQHSAYVIAALKAYKSGQRSHKTMVAQAADLSEQDMQDIAAYFASLSE